MEEQNLGRPRTPKEYLRLYLTGFGMGTADIIPGVSGGTIAFIMGIYDTLVYAIKSFNLDAIRLVLSRKFAAFVDHVSLRFLIALGLGIVTAVLLLSNLLGTLLETQPTFVFAFFGGLVLASIVAVSGTVRWTSVALVALVIGAVFGFLITGLDALDPSRVPHDYLMLFISGSIAIVAMILPGISGSFILLILGQYQFVLDAVRNRDLLSIFAVALGCVVGLVTFSRILSYLLHHYRAPTLAVLIGFMIGSLRELWEQAVYQKDPVTKMLDFSMPRTFTASDILISVLLIAAGFAVVSLLDHVSGGNNPVVKRIWARA
jgi:putative membrane protein